MIKEHVLSDYTVYNFDLYRSVHCKQHGREAVPSALVTLTEISHSKFSLVQSLDQSGRQGMGET